MQLARPLVLLDLQLVLQRIQPEQQEFQQVQLPLRGSFHQHENEVLLHRQPRLNLQPELRHHQCWMWSQQAHIPM